SPTLLSFSYDGSVIRCVKAEMLPFMPKTQDMWDQLAEILSKYGETNDRMWIPAKLAEDGKLKWLDNTDVTLRNINSEDSRMASAVNMCLAMTNTVSHPGVLVPCKTELLPMVCIPKDNSFFNQQ
ncbi:unnamed protein product, partial [Meganyctiphanes norvegica]